MRAYLKRAVFTLSFTTVSLNKNDKKDGVVVSLQ